MDVSVHYKRGQRWLRLGSKQSVLGVGILERARATSLALLGATAAVGLAIVAIALNQEWPLIAGSSIPPIPPRHQNLGEAKVAAGIGASSESSPVGIGSRGHAPSVSHNPGPHAEDASPVPESTQGGSTDFVVAPSAPAKPQGGGSHPSPQHQSPPPSTVQPQPPPATPETTAASPTAEPVSSPAPPPTSAPEPPRPPVTTSEAPPESSEPPWSHGNGHAYGHNESSSDEDEESDDDGHDWGGYEHGSHGHHYGD